MTLPKFLEHIKLDMNNGPWLAGGAARRLYHNLPVINCDWDIFCQTRKQYNHLVRLAMHHDSNPSKDFDVTDNISESKYATTYNNGGHKIQFIHKRFYETVDHLLNDFDFTVCKYATDGVLFKVGESAVEDHIKNRLRYTKSELTCTIMSRIVKYRAYGYYMDDEFSKLLNENLDTVNYNMDMQLYDF